MACPRRIYQLLIPSTEVQQWPTFMLPSELNQVAQFLGPIGDFKQIKSNNYLVEALVHLWDPECTAFRIGNRQMTITLEEVAGLLGLPTRGTALVFPFASDKAEFCQIIGLKESVLRGSDQGVAVNILFERFAPRDGFERHVTDFVFTSKAVWERKRLLVYGVVMAGTYLFPRKDQKIAFKSAKIVNDLFLGIQGKQCSIVPTILADIFLACTGCRKGEKFFHGANLVLYIWATGHFKRQASVADSLPVVGYNWVVTHPKRVNEGDLPKNASECVDYLETLQDFNIRWVLDWTDCFEPILRTKESKRVLLLGTQGIISYTPKRFLRQLGRIQGPPPISEFSEVTIFFDQGVCPKEIPMKSQITESWRTISDDRSIRYLPELKQKGVMTAPYEDWLKDSTTQGLQHEPYEEIEKLRAIIKAKDMEVVQLKKSIELHKGKAEENKRLYEKERERRQEMKRKCGELYDQAERVQMPYARESKDSVLDRLRNFGDLVRNRLRDMM